MMMWNEVLKEQDPHVQVVPARADHAIQMASHLRQADVAELRAVSEAAPEALLLASFLSSKRALAVLVDGAPAIMLGVSVHPDDAGCGVPWLLATDALYLIVPEFTKHGRRIFRELCGTFPRLANITSAANVVSRRWLTHLGFTLGPPLPGAGIHGEDLLYFHMENR